MDTQLNKLLNKYGFSRGFFRRNTFFHKRSKIFVIIESENMCVLEWINDWDKIKSIRFEYPAEERILELKLKQLLGLIW